MPGVCEGANAFGNALGSGLADAMKPGTPAPATTTTGGDGSDSSSLTYDQRMAIINRITGGHIDTVPVPGTDLAPEQIAPLPVPGGSAAAPGAPATTTVSGQPGAAYGNGVPAVPLPQPPPNAILVQPAPDQNYKQAESNTTWFQDANGRYFIPAPGQEGGDYSTFAGRPMWDVTQNATIGSVGVKDLGITLQGGD